ncbi:MAG: type II CAAX endopeptidase family protein [Nitrospira sp.]|nr:type II CAAX endopeptidase family protein [Nitrospira sp.]
MAGLNGIVEPMECEPQPNDQPLRAGEAVETVSPSPCEGSARPQFSPFVSILSALVLLATLGAILWFSSHSPKLDRFDDPDQALDLMVSRTMEAQDGLERAPRWQQWVASWTSGSPQAERDQAIQWYRELVATTGTPQAQLRLAILQGESGYRGEAVTAAQAWKADAEPLPLYARFIESAYGDRPLSQEDELALQAELAEAVPAGWFYSHLAAALAARAGDGALGATVAGQIQARGALVEQRAQVLTVVELSCLVLGSVLLFGIVRLKGQRTDILRLHQPGVPPPWPGGIGSAVLLRGGALGAVVTLVFLSFAPIENASLRALAIPAANLPLLAMAYAYLLKPAGLNFRNGFGLQIHWTQAGRLAGIVLAVVAAGLWGEWVMGRVAESLHMTNHWTEWFDPDLVWASGSVLTISLLEYVVFAPIFEELAFRGLLYAILRRRLRPLPAAMISAGIFALAHGYGVIGFLSVFWSGLLWAWIYERTGSVLPGMIAHATNNLLVCVSVMALLR